LSSFSPSFSVNVRHFRADENTVSGFRDGKDDKVTNLNLAGNEAPENSPIQQENSYGRLAIVAVSLFAVSVVAAVVLASLTDNYEALGTAIVFFAAVGYLSFRILSGLAKLLAVILVFGLVCYQFGFVGVTSYRQHKKLEAVNAIVEKHRAEFTKLGESLSADLGQCRVPEVYPMFGGRVEITRDLLSDVQVKADRALSVIATCSAEAQAHCEQVKHETPSSLAPEEAQKFFDGVDKGAIQLRDAFAARREFYTRLNETIRFLGHTYGTYQSVGDKLVFSRSDDAAQFDTLLNRLYEARKVWEP
jgi:hypothetical protein